jgi:hypothetical protein
MKNKVVQSEQPEFEDKKKDPVFTRSFLSVLLNYFNIYCYRAFIVFLYFKFN